jgi:hypothetical protein
MMAVGEKGCVLGAWGVVSRGIVGARIVKEECAFGHGAFVSGTKYSFLAS